MLSPSEARILGAVGSAFKLNFEDAPNIPADQFQVATDPDGKLPCAFLPASRALTLIHLSNVSQGSY